jgi:hypothetical protein
VVIEASLAAANDYSSVNIQYDMDAVSQALGLSTAQLKTVQRNVTPSKGKIVFAGIGSNGTVNYNTTTTTSSAQCYGHWFSTAGNVVGYDGSAAIYAEMYPENYVCKLGQYPSRLSKGRTYTIRQAIIYTHSDGKQYRATMEVHLNMK